MEKIVDKRPKDPKPLKGLLALRMRDGEFYSAIEIVDTLMYMEPYELEWRMVKAQILDSACRLDKAKEGFQFYLSVDKFNPKALQACISCHFLLFFSISLSQLHFFHSLCFGARLCASY